MLQAFAIFMATRHGGGEAPQGHDQSWRASSARETPTRARRGTASRRPPRPNHFLSVRVDNSQIWEKISSLQRDILESNQHLTGAAIPVQDSHLTLFVLTLYEHDGSLQRAKETLEHCRDLLLEHGLSPEAEPDVGNAEGDDTALGATLSSPLVLSFRDLGNFSDKVLFAKLVEDDQAARLRSLVSALHQRFSEASLVDAVSQSSIPSRTRNNGSTDRKGGGDGDSEGSARGYYSEFEPHLTIMKTSKLADRRTVIPPVSYERHQNGLVFGDYAPSSVELSSMLERENVPPLGDWEPRPYYKCEHKLPLRTPSS